MKEARNSRISRRKFLSLSGITAGTVLAFLSSCRKKESLPSPKSSKIYRWKMVTTWPKNFPVLGTGAEKLARNIEAMSGGRLQIKVYAAGELLPPFECFDAVSRGAAEMSHGASYYWKGKVPEAQFFSSVPFGLKSGEMGAWLHHGGGLDLWDKLYADFSVKPFACGNTGVQMGGWFNREIRQLSDFKGLKIRMPGLAGEVLRQCGATVVSLPGGEIFQALQSGAIDATDWIGPSNDLAFGFYKAAKYYYWPGWHEPGTALELNVNRHKYEKLPKDLQIIIQHACKAAYEDMVSEFTARNSIALVTLIQKNKIQLKKFPDEALRTLGKLSRKVVEKLSQKSPISSEIYKSYTDFRKNILEWDRIGEKGFSLARMILDKQR